MTTMRTCSVLIAVVVLMGARPAHGSGNCFYDCAPPGGSGSNQILTSAEECRAWCFDGCGSARIETCDWKGEDIRQACFYECAPPGGSGVSFLLTSAEQCKNDWCGTGCGTAEVIVCTWKGEDILQREDIPTVSEWGIAIMALLLLIGGKVYFNRRRRAMQA